MAIMKRLKCSEVLLKVGKMKKRKRGNMEEEQQDFDKVDVLVNRAELHLCISL